MASRPWYSTLGSLLPPETPGVVRLILAALSGAILSLSFRDAHSSIYSWFCLALLFWPASSAREPGSPSSAASSTGCFLCSPACPGSPSCFPCMEECPRPPAGECWCSSLRYGAARSAVCTWSVLRLSRSANQLGPSWCAILVDFHRSLSRISAGDQFSLGSPRLSGRGKSRPGAVDHDHRNLWCLLPGRRREFTFALGRRAQLPRSRKTASRLPAEPSSSLLAVMNFGPRFVPKAEAHHIARVVQPNFPETEGYAGDWYADHQADMAELAQLSLHTCPRRTISGPADLAGSPGPIFLSGSAFWSLHFASRRRFSASRSRRCD